METSGSFGKSVMSKDVCLRQTQLKGCLPKQTRESKIHDKRKDQQMVANTGWYWSTLPFLNGLSCCDFIESNVAKKPLVVLWWLLATSEDVDQLSTDTDSCGVTLTQIHVVRQGPWERIRDFWRKRHK